MVNLLIKFATDKNVLVIMMKNYLKSEIFDWWFCIWNTLEGIVVLAKVVVHSLSLELSLVEGDGHVLCHDSCEQARQQCRSQHRLSQRLVSVGWKSGLLQDLTELHQVAPR